MYEDTFEASRGAEGLVCDCKRNRLWVRFPLEENKYLLFSSSCSDGEVACGVEFHH